MQPLIVSQLDEQAAAGCQVPGCTHTDHPAQLYFHGRCHQQGRVDVRYMKGTGYLEILCSVCHRLIAQVAVATTTKIQTNPPKR